MLANCAGIGLVLGIATRRGPERRHLVAPIRVLAALLMIAGSAVVARAAWIQVVRKDQVAVAGSLAEQADHVLRFQYNPRLLAAARTIERGTIFDRNGLPLATSRAGEAQAIPATFAKAGLTPLAPCAGSGRCYPLGGVGFHLLGDAVSEANWGAPNTSFLERDRDVRLRGWNDHARSVEVRNPRTHAASRAIERDYRELLPLVRARYQPGDRAVQALLTRDRDVRSSIDARLQVRAASLLEQHIRRGGYSRGAAVVIDVDTGDVLAATSYPHPDRLPPTVDTDAGNAGPDAGAMWLDRVRYGLYPPGSTFKLLVAAAALRTGAAASEPFACVRLPDGRVGNYVHGSSRPVRDDPMDTVPHGRVDLHRGLVVSCNAYFAQLAQHLGPQPLLDAAALFQIDLAKPATAAELRRTLAHAGYGQGEVLASPVKMARVAAAIARGGDVMPVRWLHDEAPPAPAGRLLAPREAAILARDMRAVVTSGTGRVLASSAVPIAGKTGTAEVANARAHSWFAGFAPYEGQRRIAFAVIIENAGYGSRAAAPLAGDLVAAARTLGLVR
jgi:cell division protein FtsI/penicillin-binding protein 2